MNLVTLSDAALRPDGFDARFHGAALAKTHCLSCHMVNGYGGEKFEGNLAEIAKDYEEAEFVSLVLAPLSALEETTMPPLSDRVAEPERQRIAKKRCSTISLPCRSCRSRRYAPKLIMPHALAGIEPPPDPMRALLAFSRYMLMHIGGALAGPARGSGLLPERAGGR